MSLGSLHVIKQSNKICSASVVFLHGSGDTGQGLLNWVKFLVGDAATLPHIKFYFPTAPLRPYTPLQGEPSNVWFDRYSITPDAAEHQETLNSAGEAIKELIRKISEDDNLPLNRIVVGGFSMGGALALHTAYRFVSGLAGVFTLSSFLNNDSAILRQAKHLNTPLYMCHGDRDSMVPIAWGQKTYKDLTQLGVKAEFIMMNNTMHELKKHEILGLYDWLQKVLPSLESI